MEWGQSPCREAAQFNPSYPEGPGKVSWCWKRGANLPGPEFRATSEKPRKLDPYQPEEEELELRHWDGTSWEAG
jgi:hypothetical protein